MTDQVEKVQESILRTLTWNYLGTAFIPHTLVVALEETDGTVQFKSIFFDSRQITLTPKVQEMLGVFLASRGTLIKKKAVLDEMYPDDHTRPFNSIVRVWVAYLKRKLEDRCVDQKHHFLVCKNKLGRMVRAPDTEVVLNIARPKV